jgi:hypothetical protein
VTRGRCRAGGGHLAALAGLLALALIGAGAAPTAAEHEPRYRFVVLGYVTDAERRPVPGLPVKLVRDKTGFSYVGETDASGFYVIVSRLDDASAGERLTLTVGRVVTGLAARFDPKNLVDERGTRVDIVAGRAIHRPAWFHSSLRRFLSAP